MIAEKQKRANIGVGGGIVLALAGFVLAAQGGEVMPLVGTAIWLAGVVLFIWGCCNYSRGMDLCRIYRQ